MNKFIDKYGVLISVTLLALAIIFMCIRCTPRLEVKAVPVVVEMPTTWVAEIKNRGCANDTNLSFKIQAPHTSKGYDDVLFGQGCRCTVRIDDKNYIMVKPIGPKECEEYEKRWDNPGPAIDIHN